MYLYYNKMLDIYFLSPNYIYKRMAVKIVGVPRFVERMCVYNDLKIISKQYQNFNQNFMKYLIGKFLWHI